MMTLRTFIAIELESAIKDDVGRLQNRLRSRLAPGCVRWVRPEGMHLTLKFLGDTPLDRVEEVRVALVQAAAEIHPFTFTVAGLGCFPNTRNPRVVWVGLHEITGALASLRDAIEAHVAPLGFPTEGRAFKPHLTLGRIQRRASKSEVREIGEVVAASVSGIESEMAVQEVLYIKSDLRPSGAVYTTLLAARLNEE
jgi:2'-5' RNA ligase